MKIMDQSDLKASIIGTASSWCAGLIGIIDVSVTIDTAIGSAIVTLISVIVSFFANRLLKKYFGKDKEEELKNINNRSNGKA
jgi:ammonia channel protein AmtB